MKLLLPEEKDIFDVAVAIRSFEKAWGSVDLLGNYKETVDSRQLWIMKPLDEKSVAVLVREIVAEKFKSKFTAEEGYEEGIVHMRAYKVKTGFSSSSWIIKVTCIINGIEYPFGYVAAKYQCQAWLKMHEVFQFDGTLHGSSENALNK